MTALLILVVAALIVISSSALVDETTVVPRTCDRAQHLSDVQSKCATINNRDIREGEPVGIRDGYMQRPMEHCCGLCEEELDCRGWAWGPWNGGTCYLKTASGPAIRNNGTIAGYVLSRTNDYLDNERAFEKEHCRDLPNNTEITIDTSFQIPIHSRYKTSCCRLCVERGETEGCKGYTWHGPDSAGTCWLKNDVSGVVNLTGRRSGVVFSFVRPSFKVEPAVLYRKCPETSNFTVKYLEQQEFECVVHARPRIEPRWLKDGEPIVIGPNAQIGDSGRRLILVSVTALKSNGRYECVVGNPPVSLQNWTLSVTDDPTTGLRAYFGYIIVILALAATFLTISFAAYAWLKRRAEDRFLREFERRLKNPYKEDAIVVHKRLMKQADKIKYNKSFEIPRNRLIISKTAEHVLGYGGFGMVLLGYLRKHLSSPRVPQYKEEDPPHETMVLVEQKRSSKVAVKMPVKEHDISQLQMLVDEFQVHSYVGSHMNVLSLIGIVIENLVRTRELFVCLEYCGRGSLRHYLINNREDFFSQTNDDGDVIAGVPANGINSGDNVGNLLTTRTLVDFANQIATGLEYLAERLIIHRDLAARNVLLNEEWIVKICDFGLACVGEESQCYHAVCDNEKTPDLSLPLKWSAPESLLDKNSSSTSSDVWSFGVVLWEMFTLGDEPYANVKVTTCEAFVDMLKRNDIRLERPRHSPRSMFEIMERCWRLNRKDRPNVRELQHDLLVVFDDLGHIGPDSHSSNVNNGKAQS